MSRQQLKVVFAASLPAVGRFEFLRPVAAPGTCGCGGFSGHTHAHCHRERVPQPMDDGVQAHRVPPQDCRVADRQHGRLLLLLLLLLLAVLMFSVSPGVVNGLWTPRRQRRIENILILPTTQYYVHTENCSRLALRKYRVYKITHNGIILKKLQRSLMSILENFNAVFR